MEKTYIKTLPVAKYKEGNFLSVWAFGRIILGIFFSEAS